MLLQTILGNENFPTGSSKVHIFFIPTNELPGREIHIGSAARGQTSARIRLHGQSQKLPAAPGCRRELGEWTSATFDVPEGVVFKVYAQRNSAGGHREQALVYIQMRENAAHRRLLVRTTGWDRGQYASVPIEGRFDILDASDRRRLGIGIAPAFERFAEPSVVTTLVVEETLGQAISGRPVVEETVIENAEGQAVRISTERNRRDLDL